MTLKVIFILIKFVIKCSVIFAFSHNFIIIFLVDLQRDITNMYKEPPPGLHIAADEDDITKVCLI